MHWEAEEEVGLAGAVAQVHNKQTTASSPKLKGILLLLSLLLSLLLAFSLGRATSPTHPIQTDAQQASQLQQAKQRIQ